VHAGPRESGLDRSFDQEAAIASIDPDLEATVAIQAAVIAELRAANSSRPV
jgi:hypothetical protein